MQFPRALSGLAARIRILPAVLVVGTGLLVLKGNDVVIAATQELSHGSSDEAKGRPDFALDEGEQVSPAEVDVLTSLSKRRQELDSRGADMTMQQTVLAAIEKRVDEKIASLKELQAQIDKLLAKRDAEQQKQVDSLVKIYTAMKPKDAARIFNNLSDDVLIPVAGQMKADSLALILAAMLPDVAQKLTQKLANKLTLPEKAQADPVPAPGEGPDALLPPGMPQTQTSEGTPAEQQAALSPPPAPAQPAAPVVAPPKPAPVAAKPAPAKPTPAAKAEQPHKEAAPAKPATPVAAPPAKATTAVAPVAPAKPAPAAPAAPAQKSASAAPTPLKTETKPAATPAPAPAPAAQAPKAAH